MIRLGQLLKLSGLAESGAEARSLVQEGLVQVNGEVETRRGRQLHRGDLVMVDGERVRVAERTRARQLLTRPGRARVRPVRCGIGGRGARLQVTAGLDQDEP